MNGRPDIWIAVKLLAHVAVHEPEALARVVRMAPIFRGRRCRCPCHAMEVSCTITSSLGSLFMTRYHKRQGVSATIRIRGEAHCTAAPVRGPKVSSSCCDRALNSCKNLSGSWHRIFVPIIPSSNFRYQSFQIVGKS